MYRLEARSRVKDNERLTNQQASREVQAPRVRRLDATSLLGVAMQEPAKTVVSPVRKHVVRAFAVVGLLFFVLIGWFAFDSWRERQAPIPEAETIESIMGATYGRYDEEQKGWLYVGNDKRSYVVRVVHQVQLQDKRPGDGLYFVASGTPLDGQPGHLYGVFQVTRNAQTGELEQVALSERSDWGVPLTPERVRFEALSDVVWGWVLKQQSEQEAPDTTVNVTNVVLAPRDAAIVELARFRAATTTKPSVSCAQADERHAKWQARMEKEVMEAEEAAEEAASAASSASGAASSQEEPQEEPEDAETVPDAEPPARCDAATWTYRTDPIREGGAFTPLHVRQSGMLDGQPLPEKSWKIVFDPKAFVYLVPDELKRH